MPSIPRVAVDAGDGVFNGTDTQIEALFENEGRQRGPPDEGTPVKKIRPVTHVGQKFEPLIVQHRPFRVHDLPESPLKLFQKFLPESLVDNWVAYTNDNPGPGPLPRPRGSREERWKPTRASELWIWLVILLYIQINRRQRFEDYWKASGPSNERPDHSIVKYMTYPRFFLLKRRFRLHDPDSITAGVPHPFSKVAEWSDIQQAAATRFWEPGTNVAVDEGIVPFQGRSRITVDMQDKPDGKGIKVWQLSQCGYLLRWIWHIPGEKFGPVGVEFRRSGGSHPNPTETKHLCATQAVVSALIESLHLDTGNVYVDNLFTGADLFTVLRHQGIGATGTVRPNAGIYKEIVQLKALDKKGKCDWTWGQHREWPTPNNKVCIDISTNNCLGDTSEGQSNCLERFCPGVVPFNCLYGQRNQLSKTPAADIIVSLDGPDQGPFW